MLRESGEFLLTQVFKITNTIVIIYYTGKIVNIHIESLINFIQENNGVIMTKKR